MHEEISPWRLHLLRAAYLLLVVGLGAFVLPTFLQRGPTLNHMHGVVCAMLAALWLLAIVGLFHPLRMLPVLLFELVWKSLWMLVVALPLARGDAPLPPAFAGTVTDNLVGLLLLPLIPWDYVWRHYVRGARPRTAE